MSELTPRVDLDEAVKVLMSLGTDKGAVLDQLLSASDEAALVAEVVALAVESEAGLLMPLDAELETALFELGDGLRQAGVVLSLSATRDHPALLFGAPVTHALEVRFGAGADVPSLVRAVSACVPDTHQVLLAAGYDAGGALALLILDRGSYAWLRAAVGGVRLDEVLAPAAGAVASVLCVEVNLAQVVPPDFTVRFGWHLPDESARASVEAISARVRKHDPRVPWPSGHKRPAGDDFFELASALAGEPLRRCLASGGPKEWADLLYRFALATTVGAHFDVLAARLNPGMSAQSVLGLGQLTWSWFIFEALGASAEAARVGSLLDTDWVRNQERAPLAARQRAFFDLGTFLRHGKRMPALLRLRELFALTERDAFRSTELVNAALALHTEPEGDQLTHHPLFHVWPAPLYALARRANALPLLPLSNPFLGRPLSIDDVTQGDELVLRLHTQLARFAAMKPANLPPLLDPLPVIVDVRITEVDAKDAHGRTLLASRDEAEHHVVAPHGGLSMRPGEIWLLEVQSARPARARARYEDLGEVSYNISLPTGEWLSKAAAR